MPRASLTTIARCTVALVAIVIVAAVPAEGARTDQPEPQPIAVDGLITFEVAGPERRVGLMDPRTGARLPRRPIFNGLSPAFSPDGQQVAFTEFEDRDLFVANANGTDVRLVAYELRAKTPEFSADGSRILFAGQREGPGYDIYSVRPDRSDLRREIDLPGNESSPSASPDGRTIAFERDVRGPGSSDIAVYDTETEELTELTTDGSSHSPAFSPDGERIAYVHEVEGDSDVYVMDADGSDPERLTSDVGAEASPTWSPDGDRLSFSAQRGERTDVFVIDAGGANEVNLTLGEFSDPSSMPDWGAADTVAPQTELMRPPSGVIRRSPDRLRFRVTEAVTIPRRLEIRCRIDARPAFDCESPLRIGALGTGRHRVSIRATDLSGNREPTAAVAEWRVGTPPEDTRPVGRQGLISYIEVNGGRRTLASFDVETGERRAYKTAVQAVDGDFSPDGQSITFAEGGAIVVMNANGSARRSFDPGGVVLDPRFSPSGRRILFSASGELGLKIHSVRLDGSDDRVEVPGPFYSWSRMPAQSPDGRFIAYTELTGACQGIECPYDIQLFDSQSGEITQLTDDGVSAEPEFTPGGDGIVFSRKVDGREDIYAMDLDGSNVTRLTDDPGYDSGPFFSPDGSVLAFSSSRSGTSDVLGIDPSGGQPSPIAADPDLGEWGLDWSVPDAVHPVTRLEKAPSGEVGSRPRVVRFGADEAVTPLGRVSYRCRLDARPARDCESPLPVGELAPGRHRLRVVATDRAGNRDRTPAVARWRVRR